MLMKCTTFGPLIPAATYNQRQTKVNRMLARKTTTILKYIMINEFIHGAGIDNNHKSIGDKQFVSLALNSFNENLCAVRCDGQSRVKIDFTAPRMAVSNYFCV